MLHSTPDIRTLKIHTPKQSIVPALLSAAVEDKHANAPVPLGQSIVAIALTKRGTSYRCFKAERSQRARAGIERHGPDHRSFRLGEDSSCPDHEYTAHRLLGWNEK
ncbi:hypothetical protein IG631_03836 [Alternaria alternata]|nr:hypothetical protein IG631_03836 [Alternaria alternata]